VELKSYWVAYEFWEVVTVRLGKEVKDGNNINEEVKGLTVANWVTAGAAAGQSRSTSSYTLRCTSGYKANSVITKLSE
jgi:hypothetical protein